MPNTMGTSGVRDVLALDGEGRDICARCRGPVDKEHERVCPACNEPTADAPHIYTLLLSYDSKVNKTRWIDDWENGLSTWQILNFLLWLRCGHSTIACMYYGNYDVAMWLKDIPDEQKTILWKSSRLVTQSPSGRYYYLRYIPSKLFFVGDYTPDLGAFPNEHLYPLRHLRVHDVSGFAQKAFVKALDDWKIPVGNMQAMKDKRGTFRVDDAAEVTDYCETECKALATYVKSMDAMFQEEGIRLSSWHGGGALATWFMQAHSVQRQLADPEGDAYDAVLHAYFGGRSEICRMGHLRDVRSYDISSAYPAASLAVPNLVAGRWEHTTTYDPGAPYALWHVTWDTSGSGRRLGPLPLRYKKGVYYPDAGAGWAHACELATARRYYQSGRFSVDRGFVYLSATGIGVGAEPPLAFVRGLARRRVAYKATDLQRAVPYKYGLNSLYGKLAQHSVEEGRLPPYQCYYAAGLITAITRSMLLHFVYAEGLGDDDVVMLATDAVFCQKERNWHVSEQERLGYFGAPQTLDDAYFIQPGCWYAHDGKLKSRGFGARSLDYSRVADAYDRGGMHGDIRFRENRFIGLGTCAGTGDFGRYGTWQHDERVLTFYPDRKFPAPGYSGREEVVPLVPFHFDGAFKESEIYVPAAVRDNRGYIEHLDELLDILYAEDQPDIAE